MAHDQALADRIRALIADDPRFSEKRMFGGISFMLDGKMSVTASGRGGLMVRIDPADADELMATTAATDDVMPGRTMRGWLRIDSEHVSSDEDLREWVDRSVRWVEGVVSRSTPPPTDAPDGRRRAPRR